MSTEPNSNPASDATVSSSDPADVTSGDGPAARLGLVTGATGYVGGQLVTRLLDQGWKVRILTRHAAGATGQPWSEAILDRADGPEAGRVQIVEGDASDADAMAEAMAGVDVAWYLLHSMGEDDFRKAERATATAFAEAAESAAVSRIVYLGGLHPTDRPSEELSDHLASRVEVGRILTDSGVPTAALQAGVVIGAGSASFVMLRQLAERLPAAVGPSWLRNRIQPIAVEDLLHRLVSAADLDPSINRTFDVGGPDVLSYAEMMQQYAAAVGLTPRMVFTAPVTTPRAAARWIGLVTSIDSRLATPLIGSLLHHAVADEHDLDDLLGSGRPAATGFDQAVRAANRGHDPRRSRRTLAVIAAAVGATALVGTFAAPAHPLRRRLTGRRTPGWYALLRAVLYADLAVIAALHRANADESGEAGEPDPNQQSDAVALAANLLLNAAAQLLRARRRSSPAVTTVVAIALTASSVDLTRRAARSSRERGILLAPYVVWSALAPWWR